MLWDCKECGCGGIAGDLGFCPQCQIPREKAAEEPMPEAEAASVTEPDEKAAEEPMPEAEAASVTEPDEKAATASRRKARTSATDNNS